MAARVTDIVSARGIESHTPNTPRRGGRITSNGTRKETERYLFRVINRVAFVGGLLLVAIAVLPVLLPIYFDLDASIAFGGTSIIILVGVASETYDQIKSKMASKEYKGFI